MNKQIYFILKYINFFLKCNSVKSAQEQMDTVVTTNPPNSNFQFIVIYSYYFLHLNSMHELQTYDDTLGPYIKNLKCVKNWSGGTS